MKRALLLLGLSIISLACNSCTTNEKEPKRYTGDLLGPGSDLPIRYDTMDVDTYPKIKSGKIPPQPVGERYNQGIAIISFTITEKGKTENFKVLEKEGRYFAGNAVQTMKYWRFEPAQRDGQPIACDATIFFNFTGAPDDNIFKKQEYK